MGNPLFECQWRIKTSNSKLLPVGGILVIAKTGNKISIEVNGRPLGGTAKLKASEEKISIPDLVDAGNRRVHMELMLSDHGQVKKRHSIIGSIFHSEGRSAEDPSEIEETAATGVWGADEEGPIDDPPSGN